MMRIWRQSTLLAVVCCVLSLHYAASLNLESPGCAASRRNFLQIAASAAVATPACFWQAPPALAAAAPPPVDWEGMLRQIQQARKQLDPIPKLIESQKWDSVRAILVQPPLADCWAKTSRPLLTRYAEALGDKGGDELAALEAREEIVSHLRYLDMAVYNNVFNPIASVGEAGATKELIRSYYEDPLNEYKASLAAMEELIALSKDL